MQFSRDWGVTPNDVSECCLLEGLHRGRIEIRLVPKPVAIAGPFELIFEDGEDCLADHRANHVLFCQRSDPDIDVVWRGVGGSQFGLKRGIRRDLAEPRYGWKTVSDPHLIVSGQAVIAPALQVECGQVEAACPGTKKEISHRIIHKYEERALKCEGFGAGPGRIEDRIALRDRDDKVFSGVADRRLLLRGHDG